MFNVNSAPGRLKNIYLNCKAQIYIRFCSRSDTQCARCRLISDTTLSPCLKKVFMCAGCTSYVLFFVHSKCTHKSQISIRFAQRSRNSQLQTDFQSSGPNEPPRPLTLYTQKCFMHTKKLRPIPSLLPASLCDETFSRSSCRKLQIHRMTTQ